MATVVQTATSIQTPVPPRMKRKFQIQPYLLLLPSVVFLAVFTVWPMASAVYRSFFYDDPAHQKPVFAGLGNFSALFSDSVFWTVMKNTAWFILGTVPVSILLALILAVFVNRRYRLTPFFRVAFFHPVVLPMVSAASIWLFMYTPQYGTVNQFLTWLGFGDVNWLGQTQTALIAIIIMSVWKQVGYFMVFYLAGLQNLPSDVFGAGALDGASGFRMFRTFTFPLLMPTTLFVGTMAIVNSFQMIDQLYVMTQGGPGNATNMLLYYIYQQAFSFNDFGKASALSVILIVVLVAFALVQTAVDRKVHYQ